MSGPAPLEIAPPAEDCALLLVDLQVGAVSSLRTTEPSALRDRVIALATLANLHNIPAVLTAGRKPGADGVFLPELRALLPGGRYVERTRAAAFEEAGVRDAIAGLGKSALIVAGVATDVGVLFAALGARNAGYRTWVVVDACGAVDAAAEDAAKTRMINAGVVVTGWASLAVGWMGDFEGPLGLTTMALLATRLSKPSGPF